MVRAPTVHGPPAALMGRPLRPPRPPAPATDRTPTRETVGASLRPFRGSATPASLRPVAGDPGKGALGGLEAPERRSGLDTISGWAAGVSGPCGASSPLFVFAGAGSRRSRRLRLRDRAGRPSRPQFAGPLAREPPGRSAGTLPSLRSRPGRAENPLSGRPGGGSGVRGLYGASEGVGAGAVPSFQKVGVPVHEAGGRAPRHAFAHPLQVARRLDREHQGASDTASCRPRRSSGSRRRSSSPAWSGRASSSVSQESPSDARGERQPAGGSSPLARRRRSAWRHASVERPRVPSCRTTGRRQYR